MSVKHIRWLIFACLILGFSGIAQAQTPLTNLERLEIELWPDFDRPSVLLLVTATLPEDAVDPSSIVLPLPEEATLNAVARMDVDGRLFTDIEYDDGTPGEITIVTGSDRFQVEYYMPYEADDLERIFAFEWRSDVSITALELSVQQPALAEELSLLPEPASVNTGAFGLQYHLLPVRSLPAGQTLSLELAYTMAQDRLTREVLDEQEPSEEATLTGPSPIVDFGPDINIGLIAAIAGGLVLAAAIAWFIVSSRASSKRVVKPKPVRAPKNVAESRPVQSGSRYCHECGQPVEQEDRFCRSCGTPVKGRGA